MIPATGRSVALSAVTITTVGVLPVYLVGVLSVQVRADLGFGPAALGLLAAAFFSTSAVASFLAGPVARRFGSPAVVRGAATTSSLALLLVATVARDLPALAAALVLGGIANALANPPATP